MWFSVRQQTSLVRTPGCTFERSDALACRHLCFLLPALLTNMRFDGGTNKNVHYVSCLRTAVTNGTQSHPADMIETIRGIDPLDKESHRYQQEPNPAAADFDPKQCLSKGEKIPVFDEIVKVPAAPPASYFGAAPKRRLSESGTTMTTSGSYNHLLSLEGSGSGEEGISHAYSADAGVAVAPPAPEGTDSSPPARPVAKRANSLGHLATDGGSDSSDISDQPKQTTTTRGLFQKLGLRRHTMQHHRSNSASDVLDVSGRGGDMNTTRPTPKPPVPAPAANRKPKAVPARFHHRCTMEDSIHVQLHKQVLDDEEHEENPHLQDYLKPKQFVHMSKRESQDNLLHLETQYLRPKVKPMVVAEEESSDEENENENDDPLPSASAAANVIDADVAAGIAADADADADEVSVERTEVHDEPITAVAHKKCDPNEPLRSCMKKAWGQDTEPRKPKRNVIFHEVTVRDYGITLGDHPNVSYGPPITLSWDYLEYDPLDIDEYEIHHPKRRNLRQMGLNYYQRRNLLLLQTDYTEEELRLAWKSVKKAKQQRYITRTYTSAFPVRIVEDACQSAVRKVKRTMSGGGKRSSQ